MCGTSWASCASLAASLAARRATEQTRIEAHTADPRKCALGGGRGGEACVGAPASCKQMQVHCEDAQDAYGRDDIAALTLALTHEGRAQRRNKLNQ